MTATNETTYTVVNAAWGQRDDVTLDDIEAQAKTFGTNVYKTWNEVRDCVTDELIATENEKTAKIWED